MRATTIYFHLGFSVFLQCSLSNILVSPPSAAILCSRRKGSLLPKMPMTESVLVTFLARKPTLSRCYRITSLTCSLPSLLVTVFSTLAALKLSITSAFAISSIPSTLYFFVEFLPPTMSFRVVFTTQ